MSDVDIGLQDYIITVYPTLYRRFLIKDVTSEDEAWDKYNAHLEEILIDEDYVGADLGEIEIDLVTPEIIQLYGLAHWDARVYTVDDTGLDRRVIK